jgi:methylated-DNA-[protein]-cysteine S-methyltransferase
LKWRDPETADEVVIATAVGPIGLTAAGDALTGVWLRATKPCGPAPARGVLAEAARQLASYFAGRLRVFDLPLAPRGTPFQQKVWAGLRRIPYGTTWSYGRLAEEIGQPTAVRAVGLANGRNPVGIVVPCHRVIGSNGSMTGYGGGLERKRFLLDLEAGDSLF